MLHPQGVMYRGRRFTAQQLGAQSVAAHPKHHPRLHAKSAHPPELQRLRFLSWNTGGLGGGLFDELMTWLDSSNLDVVCIAETRWQFTSNWSTNRWHCIHNGPEPGSREKAGVLIMISARLTSSEQLQFQHLIPGRLTHAKIFLEHNALDVFGIYQKAWCGRDKAVLQQRKTIWKALEDQARLLPDRNDLTILGDFNVSPGQHGSSFGPAAWQGTQHQAPDGIYLRRQAEDHQLVALNTWDDKEHAFTYMWGQVRSQIDFILVKKHRADSIARAARPARAFPVGQWREGAIHFAILASVPRPWRVPRSQNRTRHGNIDVEGLIADMQHGSERLTEMQCLAHASLSLCSAPCAYNAVLQNVAETCYPSTARPPPVKPWQDARIVSKAKQMWSLFKEMRLHSTFGLSRPFQAWRRWSQFMKLHKERN